MLKGLPHRVNSTASLSEGAFEMLWSPHVRWTKLAQEQMNYISNSLLINTEHDFSICFAIWL